MLCSLHPLPWVSLKCDERKDQAVGVWGVFGGADRVGALKDPPMFPGWSLHLQLLTIGTDVTSARFQRLV